MMDRYSSSYKRHSESSLHSNNNHHQYPSFSSTLLDSIYQSIDLGEDHNMRVYGDLPFVKTTSKHKHHHHDHHTNNADYYTSMCPVLKTSSNEDIANLRRACMIEKWMDKKSTTTQNIVTKASRKNQKNSSSSSEDEPFHVHKPKEARTIRLDMKPIKTRALKMYGDLKKIKQPISPGGGKVAAFLNSIISAASPRLRKPKITGNHDTTTNTPSSFSRSCLSKTPSCRGKSEKRTVRFFVDEKSLHGRENNELIMAHVRKNNGRVAMDEDHEDNDDAESYASSDLFELDNLSAIGMERYAAEELPVYETTSIRTNRAIASGFIL